MVLLEKDFGFNATFYENERLFPMYLDSAARKSRVVPGQGRVKKFDTDAFHYAFNRYHQLSTQQAFYI